MTQQYDLFVTSPRGVEALVAEEIRALGAEHGVQQRPSGVELRGTLELAYRICLWSRVANRVLLPIARFGVSRVDDLYDGVLAVPWQEHLTPRGTLAVDVTATGAVITHSQFAARRVKDAVADQFRARTGRRPSVDLQEPDVRINVRVREDRAVVSIDLSGTSLHRRGYRQRDVAAPLKENLAAAILLHAGWAELATAGGGLVDPMCGSGTFPIEAALIAGDIAPGLLRSYFGMLRWRGHASKLWRDLKREAEDRRVQGLAKLPRLVGYDADPRATHAAERNVTRAGLTGRVQVECCPLTECRPGAAAGTGPGLVVTNPPYGHRVATEQDVPALYETLGDVLRRRFRGWRACVLTPCSKPPEKSRYERPPRGRRTPVAGHRATGGCWLEQERMARSETAARTSGRRDRRGEGDRRPAALKGCSADQRCFGNQLLQRLRLEAASRRPLYNGALPCVLLEVPVPAAASQARDGLAPATTTGLPSSAESAGSAGAEMLRNRLLKNKRRLERWADREGIHCYRLYDADLPEYAVAIDVYEQWLHIQEYAAPRTIPAATASARLEEVLQVAPPVLGVEHDRVAVKVRRRQRDRSQYEKLDDQDDLYEVRERDFRFLVNLTDRLDTGLFLDHRDTRALVGRLAEHQDFLNLFGYTATATVYAARGGARSTTTVDLSNTYLDWARRNLERNGIATGDEHRLVRASCLDWLRQQPDADRRRYGLIFADAPTFSNSKKTPEAFDVQRDHVALVRACCRLLLPRGVLLFANHQRRFKLDESSLADLEIEEITEQTLPHDFQRGRPTHRCWRICNRG